MILYTISEIESLKLEINGVISCRYIRDIMIERLDKAENYLYHSLTEYEADLITKAVVLDKLTKGNIEITEIVTWIGNSINFIEDEFAHYIVENLHLIRDHITLIMGKIVNTPLVYEIANIEINIANLSDTIYNYNTVSIVDTILININLWQATECLDCAIINLAAGNIEQVIDCIQMTICNLKQTKIIVSFLNWINSINDEETQDIKNLIQIQIDYLDYIITM